MKKTELGQRLIAGLQEALEFERGQRKLRVTIFAAPARAWSKEDIARLRREGFKMSQTVFASCLNVTPATVRAWEQGQKTPSGTARRLLEIAELQPEAFTLWTLRKERADVADLRAAQAAWAAHSQVADRAITARKYFSRRRKGGKKK